MQTRQQKRKQDTGKPTTRSKNSKLVKTTSSGRRVIPTLHALNAAEDAEDYDEGNLEMVEEDDEEEINPEDEEEYTPDSEKKNTDKSRTTARLQDEIETMPTPPPDEMDESNPLEEEDNEGASALISLFSSGALFSPPKEDAKSKKKKAPVKKKKKVKTEKRPRQTTKKSRTKPKSEFKRRTSSDEDYQEEGRRNGMRRSLTPFTRESLDKLFMNRKFVEQPPMSLRTFDQEFLRAINSKRNVEKDYIFTSVPPPIELPQDSIQEIVQSKSIQSDRSSKTLKRCATHVIISYFIYDKQKGDGTDPTLEARILKERALNKKQTITQKNRPLQTNKYPQYQPRGTIGTSPTANLTPGLNSRQVTAPLMMAPSQLRSYPPTGYPNTGGRGTNIQPLPSQLPLSNIGTRPGFPLTMQQGQNLMFSPYPYLVNQNLMNQRRPSSETQIPLQQRMQQRAPTTSPQQKKMQPNGQTNPQSPVGNKPMTQQDQKNTRIYPPKPVSMNVIGETTPQNLPQ